MSIEKSLKRIADLLEERLPVLEDFSLELQSPYESSNFTMQEILDEMEFSEFYDKDGTYKFETPRVTTLEVEIDSNKMQELYDLLGVGEWVDPYEDEYYYVILADPYQTDGLTRLLKRNEFDFPVIEGEFFQSEEDMWFCIEGSPDYMFTEEEIMSSHPYLWECRKGFN